MDELIYNGTSGNSPFSHMPKFTIATGCYFLTGLVLNVTMFLYIVTTRLYRNFVSSHFIAHMALTNILLCAVLMPLFLHDVWTGQSLIFSINAKSADWLCRFQAMFMVTAWSVVHYMVLCISGAHLLTFARIHYDQLFGVSPCLLCFLSWIGAAALSLPNLSNQSVVSYDADFHWCIWQFNADGLKAMTYFAVFGYGIPSVLMWYAYARVLGILYHSPVVFQALGLYSSRWLLYGMAFGPLYFLPLLVTRAMPSLNPLIYAISAFLANCQIFTSPILYGLSTFLLKEEDMILTAKAQKSRASTAYAHPGVVVASSHQL